MAPSAKALKLISALRLVRVDTINTRAEGRALSRRGSASSPSITGISTSSRMMSGALRATSATASLPLAWRATTSMSVSSLSQRETRPRTTAESSTIITLMGVSPTGSPPATGAAGEISAS
jgi:hypothetical protein